MIFLLLRTRAGTEAGRGWRLPALFLILHGCARAAVEPLRAKQDQLAGRLTVDLLLALTAIAAGFALRAARGFVPGTREPV